MIQGPKKSRNVTMLIWVLTPVNFDYNFAVEVKFSPTVTVCLLIIILKMYNVNKNIKKTFFVQEFRIYILYRTGQDPHLEKCCCYNRIRKCTNNVLYFEYAVTVMACVCVCVLLKGLCSCT